MNTTNANSVLGFDKFENCDYNLHWSFSNFNRMLIAANQIASLRKGAKVLELCCGSSNLLNLVKSNFKRSDIDFYKVDGDEKYKFSDEIFLYDIESNEFDNFCKDYGPFDCIIFMEAIEHFEPGNISYSFDDEVKEYNSHLIEKISKMLIPEGMLIITAPTPPFCGMFEDRVWPTDHKTEPTQEQLYTTINKWFKINKSIGWSLEERDYNTILEENDFLRKVYVKLSKAYPDSYVKAIIASLAPDIANRQILYICKKRRIANGRLT